MFFTDPIVVPPLAPPSATPVESVSPTVVVSTSPTQLPVTGTGGDVALFTLAAVALILCGIALLALFGRRGRAKASA